MNDACDLVDWIIRHATESQDLTALVEGLSLRLAALGVPLQRLQVSMRSIDPKHRGVAVTWTLGQGVVEENTAHGNEETFQRSPINLLLAAGKSEGRWNLSAGEGVDGLPILADLERAGSTDYVLRLVSFPSEAFIGGMACSLATEAPGGFCDQHLRLVDMVLPAVGLAAYRFALTRTATEALKVYVGPRTSARILAGQIRQGEGQAIYAAILFADMKNFTGLNERYPPDRIVGWLNEQFEALGAEIDRHGGEILKFMGDSVLAIFPVDNSLGAVNTACVQALAAAETGLAAVAALNAQREGTDEPVIPIDVVLHLGEVFYGNVGAARRLDFTVIGPVVNEASRLEALCDGLGRNLLLSKVFADHCGVETERLGTFELKGVKLPHTVYGIGKAAARNGERRRSD
ncbi:MAG: adenylate/guanylate cyclase domain-containing protein [Rhizobiaceae bacterium]|nr:adenylate/guanylate cyclase domain-containing protein [Rhizobiaceae bacterium]